MEKVAIVSDLETATGLPVLVDNAASAAALGVEWQMLPSHGSFLYCYWGLGIGGGLVIGGEAYRGSTGNVAELGHVVVNENGRPCACGGRGCLEAESSAAALLRDARQFGQFSSIEAVAAASLHMSSVRQLLEKAAQQMAAALVTAINLTDVPEVVIGGAHFAAVEEIFLPILRSAIEGQVLRRHIAPVALKTTDIGEEANAIGAAALVLHGACHTTPHRTRTRVTPSPSTQTDEPRRLAVRQEPPPAGRGRSARQFRQKEVSTAQAVSAVARAHFGFAGTAASNPNLMSSRRYKIIYKEERDIFQTTRRRSCAALMAAVGATAGLVATGAAAAREGRSPWFSPLDYNGNDTLDNWITAAAKSFEKSHPNVTVDIRNIVTNSESTYYAKLDLAERSSSTTPDISYEDSFLVQSDAAAGYIRALPQLTSDPEWKTSTPCSTA